MHKTRIYILRHYPSNTEYYNLFVGTHLREAIEKEITKFSHRLENAQYEIDLKLPETSSDNLTILNTNESMTTATIYFNKSDFSKASLKILNHFAHDTIGTMWETTPSHVMEFELLYASDNGCYLMTHARMSSDIVEIDDKVIFIFASTSVLSSPAIEIPRYKIGDTFIIKSKITEDDMHDEEYQSESDMPYYPVTTSSSDGFDRFNKTKCTPVDGYIFHEVCVYDITQSLEGKVVYKVRNVNPELSTLGEYAWQGCTEDDIVNTQI